MSSKDQLKLTPEIRRTLAKYCYNQSIGYPRIIQGYTIASAFCRVNHKHGGTMILIREDIEYQPLYTFNAMSIEIDVEISAVMLPKERTIVVSIYRSPNGNFDAFINVLSKLLVNVDLSCKVFIAGDFNVNFAVKSNNREILLDVFRSSALNLTTLQYTRITTVSGSCIDNIFTNLAEADYNVKTVNLHIADHLAQILEYHSEVPEPVKSKIKHNKVNLRKTPPTPPPTAAGDEI
ncbi:Endonuclease-reverse transcriptase [Popillia japonica]|uniref:Endonuclease-reverse transcriptase n=1 Tax=Popillia japonica TaxID=7064 RepID=A0AAW1IX77_POPJA